MPFDQILVQIVNGLVNGMILALVASGLTLIFGIMDIVNFAHGDLFMLGAYIGTTIFFTDRQLLARAASAPCSCMAVLGAMLCRSTALRPLVGRDPLTTILATFGISLVIQNYALWQYGPVPRRIVEPVTGHFQLFYVEYPWYRLVIAVLSAAIIGGLYLFMKYGKHGIWIRATTQDRVMAEAMGIPGAVGAHRRCSRSARPWRRPAACSSVPWSASTTRWASTSRSRPSWWSSWAAWATSLARSWPPSSSSLLESLASIWMSPAQAVIVSFVALIFTLLFRPTGLFVPTPK